MVFKGFITSVIDRVNLFQIISLVVLARTAKCLAVIPADYTPELNPEAAFTTDTVVDINPSDDNDDHSTSSQLVKPTRSSVDEAGQTRTELNPANTDIRPTASADIEQPVAVSKWLKTLRELEQQSKNIDSNRGEDPSVPKVKEVVELPSPDELFKWLDNIPPFQKDKTPAIEELPEEKVKKITDHKTESIHKLKLNISDSKLIFIISGCASVFVVLIIIMTIFIVCKKRISNKKRLDVRIDFLGNNHKNSTVFNAEGKDNIFMGIPANNEIWKQIQELPSTASSVLPESKHI